MSIAESTPSSSAWITTRDIPGLITHTFSPTPVHPVTLADLEAEVAAYEKRYGVPSERMVETFDDGEPDEDQFHWCCVWSAVQRVRHARTDGAS